MNFGLIYICLRTDRQTDRFDKHSTSPLRRGKKDDCFGRYIKKNTYKWLYSSLPRNNGCEAKKKKKLIKNFFFKYNLFLLIKKKILYYYLRWSYLNTSFCI
jgi:hypothetical protein